jgi:hypothetical protein
MLRSSGNLTLRLGWTTRESGAENLDRDIVDTYLHASREMGTTRPNKWGFHLYEGKVWTGTHSQCIGVWVS